MSIKTLEANTQAWAREGQNLHPAHSMAFLAGQGRVGILYGLIIIDLKLLDNLQVRILLISLHHLTKKFIWFCNAEIGKLIVDLLVSNPACNMPNSYTTSME